MFEALASPAGLSVLITIFAVGLIGALIVQAHDVLANIWSHGSATVGSLWGMLFASSVLTTGQEVVIKANISSFSLFHLSLRVDKLAAFFVFVICLVVLFCSVYGVGYVSSYYKRYSIGALGFFYNAFILGMLLVVTAANGIWFLVAWEIMSLASYFLVVYDRHDRQNVRAGYVYLVMTHIGAACIMLAMLILFSYTHSFEFDVIKSHIDAVPQLLMGAVFGLSLIGLGTKAGVVPLHIWLPSAHPAAPSHVSALMSGVMIKTGIYMMIRLFLDVLGPPPLWWGMVVLIIGGVSSVLGVLYALTEHDIKRLLAYHSIENIGIILLGLGSALIFSSLHRPELVLLSLCAALFHTLNHATFKSLLFLGAGSVIRATHTRNIEKYGGLIKLMPITALCFLVGSMAITALPPFNGFFSEWLTFQSMFSGLTHSVFYVKGAFMFAAAALAITGGLALACFVKAFGSVFLARPRSDAAQSANEASPLMSGGMIGLATLCLVIGLLAAPITRVLLSISRDITGLQATASAVGASSGSLTVRPLLSSVSGPVLGVLIIIVPVGVWLASKYAVYRRQKISMGPTWDCGTELNGRMEITATGFARSIILIFKGLLRPSLQHNVEYDDANSRYMPSSRRVAMSVHDVFQDRLYSPFYAWLLRTSKLINRIQHGNLNAYVLYVMVALIIVLLVGA
ncbi:MAG: hydrogenase 4 subunit B [Patescibacteria group bacterium]